MTDKKNEPSLEDLGLDGDIKPASASEKISIRSLQLESENESLSTSGQHQAMRPAAAAEQSENVLGIVGFVLSIVGLLSAGCISPISMIICFIALGKKPIGLAVAGLILSGLGSIGMLIGVILFVTGMLAS